MAVLVGEPILEHESRRRVERKHPPPAVVPVAFRTRHVVTNRAPRHKVVVDERHWVRRRTPPTFQLPRVGPQLPNPSDIGVKLGRYCQSESIEILLHVNNSHPYRSPPSLINTCSARSIRSRHSSSNRSRCRRVSAIPARLPRTSRSRPRRRLVTRPARSRTPTCFCTAAKLIGYSRASAETESSVVIVRITMSRLVASASA